jgi:hypothetical protein
VGACYIRRQVAWNKGVVDKKVACSLIVTLSLGLGKE